MKFVKLLKYFVAILFLGVFLRWIDFLQNISQLSDLNLLYVFYGLSFMVFGSVLRGIRFWYFARSTHTNINLFQSIASCFVGNFFALITPGRAGEVVKVAYFDNKKSLSICAIFEKFLDMIILGLAALSGAYLLQSFLSIYLVFLIGLLGMLLVFFKLDSILNFILRRKYFDDGWALSVARQISIVRWINIIILTIGIYVSGILAQYTLLLSFDVHFDIFFLIQVSSLSVLAGIASGVPTGLGVTQGSFTALTLLRYPTLKETVGLFNVLLLCCAYAVGLVGGGIAMLFLKKPGQGK